MNVKLFRALLLLIVAVAFLAGPADAQERLRDLKKEVKDVLENHRASPAEKIALIKRFGKLDGTRDAGKAVKELLGFLVNDDIFSDDVTKKLRDEYEAAASKYSAIDAQVRDGNMLRFGGGRPTQEEYNAAQQAVAEARQRLNGGNTLRQAIVDTIAGMSSAEAMEEINETLEGRRTKPEQVAVCVDVLFKRRPAGTWEKMLAIYEANDDPQVRASIVVGLRMWDENRAAPLMFKALSDDKCWLGRSHAIQALFKIRSREAIGALVDRLGKETGRLRWDIIDGLSEVSGERFGEQDSAWRAWWSKNQENFQPRPMGSGVPADPRGAAVTGAPTFYGVPVRGNPLFIIDRSGSMLESSKSRGQTPPGQAPQAVPPGEKSKWQVLQEELFKAIRGLPETARFGIVWFDTEVDAHKNGAIVTATQAEKDEAVRIITPMSANGLTNIYGAFERGFAIIKPGGLGGGGAGGGAVVTGEAQLIADEIFFLTDGSPTVGEAINGISPTNGGNNREYSKLLLEKICEWNKPYNMVINTICVGMGDDAFLSQLAQRNRGKFVKVD